MGLWADHILPRAVSWGMSGETFGEQREAALRSVSGRVLELGFGAGLNLPHYPPGVTELLALEPSHVARKLSAERVAQSPFPVTFTGLDGASIPVADESVDTVVSTWTLCTIPDIAAALREVARVLRPGGTLRFLEHGLSRDAKVARWQGRLNPLQKRLFGGCHLDRRIDELVRASPLELEDVEEFTMKGPSYASYLYRGTARKATNRSTT